VKYVTTGGQHARVHAHEDKLAHERVGSNLERQGRHPLFFVRLAAYFVAGLWVVAPNGVDVERAWQKAGHEVGQLLHDHAAAVGTFSAGLGLTSSTVLRLLHRMASTSSGLGKKSVMRSSSFSTVTPRPSPPVTRKKSPANTRLRSAAFTSSFETASSPSSRKRIISSSSAS